MITVALPIADRGRSFAFYRDGLGLEPVGPIAEDGYPEPLQFVLADGARLMLVPTGGFGWVTNRPTVTGEDSECVLTLSVADPAAVDRVVATAVEAGARVVTAPGQQPWGYAGTFADPDDHLWMVTPA